MNEAITNDYISTQPALTAKLSVEELAHVAIGVGMDKKAFKPVLIDLKPIGAFTEYFAILSGTNPRHVNAIAENIRLFFKNTFGLNPVAADGLETNTWILLDYGAFFVHIFQEATRELYKLENLWSKGRFVDISEEHVQQVFKKVKTDSNS